MLFNELIIKTNNLLQPEFDRLFFKAMKNQTHEGDMLILSENGFYLPEALTWDNLDEPISPYMLGPSNEGHSEMTHYRFINHYRKTSVAHIEYSEYLKLVEYSESRSAEIDKLNAIEETTINFEMLIYLKIWEADTFIKKLYQLVRLATGQPYDWHFKIQESNRDNDATGKRDHIIRKLIRTPLENEFPNIFNAFKNSYHSQVRNSIAHSKYSIIGRHIQINNFIKEDPASQLKVISFDRWTEIFNNTLALYNQLIGLFNKTQKAYYNKALQNGLIHQIRITNDSEITFRTLKLDPISKRWL